VAALVAGEPRTARAVVWDGVFSGASPSDLYLDVLAPALHEIGDLWARAEISVAHEHLATAVTESLLAELAASLHSSGAGATTGAVIVACTPGELHCVGARMVADFLEAGGWDVLAVGASTPAEALAELAGTRTAVAVALSSSLPERLQAAERACSLLRELPDPPLIVVGGQGYDGSAERASRVGADALVSSPPELVAYLTEHRAAIGA
jgi:methanogenic corrinoid protein MtbC1